jgi:hypothetical protein
MSGIIVPDDSDKPDPEEFKIHMRTVKASDDASFRHDDFVGSYNKTGRIKLDKPKWAPKEKPMAGDNSFRAEDWMGSGKTERKTWKVKTEDPESAPIRNWKPPPKDEVISAPWEHQSPPGQPSTPRKWAPKKSMQTANETHEGQPNDPEMPDLGTSSSQAVTVSDVLSDSIASLGLADIAEPDSPGLVSSESSTTQLESHDSVQGHEPSCYSDETHVTDSTRPHKEFPVEVEPVQLEVVDRKSFDETATPQASHMSPSSAGTRQTDATQVGIVVGEISDEKPDPEEFKIHMRTVRASNDASFRHDDYVGSYNKTGRIKLNKPKWAPKEKPVAGDNSFRAEDWMGSGKTERKTWKVKN